MAARDLELLTVSAPSFVCSVSSNGCAVVVVLSGDVDFAASAELRRTLNALVESGTAPVVVNLSGVRLIDAAAVRVIVDAHAAAVAHGRCLYVDGLRELPARVFDILGLNWLRCPTTGSRCGSRGGRR